MPKPALRNLSLGNYVPIVTASEAEDVDLIAADVEARHRLDQREHNGIIRPNAAVNERVAAMLERTEIARRRGGREANVNHPLEAIGLVVRMVRCLEHEHLAVPPFERGNAQADFGLTKQRVAELIGEQTLQRVAIVEVARVMPLVAEPRSQAAERRKDFASPSEIKVQELPRGIPGSQPEGEDAACRGACNKIEVSCD